MDFSPGILFNAGPVIASHALAAIAAFLLGIVQMQGMKGTLSHRTLGYLWAILMLWVAISSFWIHHNPIMGPFSLFHILSLIVLITVPMAVHSAHKGRVREHRSAMLSLFTFALIVAGAFTLLPGRIMHAVIFGFDSG